MTLPVRMLSLAANKLANSNPLDGEPGMRSLVKVLLVVAVLVTTAGQVQATIVYQLNNPISSGSVTGTIQTDGTIRTLTVPNITD